MNAGKAVYGILSANTGVTDIVGTNIFPEIAEQETAVPFIVYQLQNVAPEDTHDGPSKLDEVQFEFLCYADSYNAAADLGVAVRAALDRVSGTYNGVHVESVQFNDVDVEIEYDPRRYSQVLKFTFRIKRDDVTIALGTPVTGAVLGDLSDVDVTGVTNGQLIAYNSTSGNWEAANDAGGANELSDLSDANVSLPSDGEVLIYSGGEFVNDNIAISNVTGLQAALDAAPDNLRELTDVTISGLADNDYLQYDSASGEWQNSTLIVGRNGEQYTGNYDSEAETLLDGATETVELYYTAQANGDGLHEDAQTDTATTGFDIRRKLYYAEKAQADPNTSGDWTQFADIADDTTYASAKATLLAYLKARTGGTVPISLKMTWEEVAEAPTFTGLLNESYGSGAAAAYGTRRLNGNYTGACMTIRRASDGTTQAIGFVGEEIDESAITTFCTGTTCTVQVWHDQSQTGGTGSGNDASQTTPANQPTIYTGGALVKEGGRLALDFDGSNDYLSANAVASTFTGLAKPLSSFVISQSTATQLKPVYAFGSSSTNNSIRWFGTSPAGNGQCGFQERDDDGSPNVFIDGGSMSVQNLGTVITNGDNNRTIYVGGTLGENSTADVDTITLNQFAIGALDRTSVSNYWDGIVQEIVLYSTEKTSDRTSIEGNISGYYQSAKLLNEAYGSGAAAAYSVRQLNRDYTGAALQVERSSDNTTQDIGFDANGDLDESALTTFCTGTTCRVRTWYDQSQAGGTGSGNDAVQTTHANQPTIYTGGAIVKENGRVAIDFNGTSDHLTGSGLTLTSSDTYFSTLFKVSNTAVNIFDSVVSTKFFLQIDASNNFDFNNGAATDLLHDNDGARYLAALDFNSTTLKSYFNGTNTQTATVSNVSVDGIQIGKHRTSQTGWIDGTMQELIYWNQNKNANHASIESNVGDYFTQNTPLLDTYTGAAAAYSLRKLRSAYSGSAIRVRRASDNTEQDIGFNVFGELDTVSLASFCSGTNGFVKTWYDQSGNANDATQTNTANQPKIYDSSTGVVTDNGKPAIKWDGSDDYLETPSYDNWSNGELMFSMVLSNPSLGKTMWDIESGVMRYSTATPTQQFFLPYPSQDVVREYSIPSSQYLVTCYYDGTENAIYNNGVEMATVTTSNTIGDQNVTGVIGSRTGASQFSTMYCQELIHYPSDVTSNRTNIESNINTFYSIY